MATLRGLAMPIGVIAAVLLVLLFNPWYVIDEGPIRVVLTVAFWLSFIILLVALFDDRNEPAADEMEIDGPRFVRFLFHNTRAGLFWLPIFTASFPDSQSKTGCNLERLIKFRMPASRYSR